MTFLTKIYRIILYYLSKILSGDFAYFTMLRLRYKVDLRNVSIDKLGILKEIGNMHMKSGGPSLQHILNTLNITSTDSVIDIGCGKGSALITIAKFPFKKKCGIELSSDFVKIAEQNFAKLGITDIELYCCDARFFSDFDEFNVIYMYNPFPCAVMQKMMENISNSLKLRPREIRIIYLNPICHQTLLETSLFDQITSFDSLGDKM